MWLSVGSVYEKENVGKATLFGLPLSSLNIGLTSGFAPFVELADAAVTVSVAASATRTTASIDRRKR